MGHHTPKICQDSPEIQGSEQVSTAARLAVLLAYDGSAHRGWQALGDGSSVQEEVEKSVGKVLKSPGRVVVHASGRTDAGVHALGQVAHFDLPAGWAMAETAWCAALNGLLPPSIRVLGAASTGPNFHARYSATGKHYRYLLCNHPLLPPEWASRAGHWSWPLDRPAMMDAAPAFLGEHDFSCFAAYRKDGTDGEPGSGSNVRRIARSELARHGDWLVYDVEGSGFLYRMVRLMVGGLLMVGKGVLDRDGLAALLECPRDPLGRLVKSPYCAEGNGLTLMRVDYDPAVRPEFVGGPNWPEGLPPT